MPSPGSAGSRSRLPLNVGASSARGAGRERIRRLARSIGFYILVGGAVLAVGGPRTSNEAGTAARAESVVAPAMPAPSAKDANGVSGVVRFVNGLTRVVRIAGDQPFHDAILLVTGDTRIQVRGRVGSFDDLREGERVSAAYERRLGIDVARSIDVK